jgi:hypothetical protein
MVEILAKLTDQVLVRHHPELPEPSEVTRLGISFEHFENGKAHFEMTPGVREGKGLKSGSHGG